MVVRSVSLGAGLGLLVASLIFYAGQSLLPDATALPSPQETPAAGTASDWKQAAQQAGMAVLTQQELEQRVEQARLAGAEQKAKELQEQRAGKVFVYIPNGMGSADVAQLLHASGVIENREAFLQARAGQANPIRMGTYELPLKANPQEVLRLLSNP